MAREPVSPSVAVDVIGRDRVSISDSECRQTADLSRGFLSLDELRQVASERVELQSVHQVAAAAEMAPGTLRKFLAGAPLRNRARINLTRWLRQTEREADQRAQRCVRMLTEVLADLPEHHRIKAARSLLVALQAVFRTGVGAVPLWLKQVSTMLEVANGGE